MTRGWSFASWLETRGPALCRAIAWLTSIAVAAPIVYQVAGGSKAYIGLFEDDYFYYAVIADKLATVGRMTYDGVTVTNGFHPLWFAILFLVRVVFGRFGLAFYTALAVLIAASSIATYELSRRFARALGASSLLAPLVAVVYTLGSARLASTGMECVVAVPLLLAFLGEAAVDQPLTPRRAVKLGVLAGLATLGRLDIAIVVILLVVAFLAFERPKVSRAARLIGAFSIGMIPVLAYAAVNVAYFGSILPVSAMAKQLLLSRGFSVWYAYTVAFFTLYGPTVGFVLPAGAISLIVLVRAGPRENVRARVVGGAAIVFAFLFFGINATSGWIFFSWYSYPLAPALVASLVFLVEALAPRVGAPRLAGALALAAAALPILAVRYFVLRGPSWTLADNALAAASVDLADHVRDRDGRYAMGAVCGMATYALDKPMLQIEGIVADRAMVEHIRHQDPLLPVLESYGADYLVVSYLPREKRNDGDGCFLIDAPAEVWSGKHTAKMHARICTPPVLHLTTTSGINPYAPFPGLETYVFDVHAARRGELAQENPGP